MSVFFSASTQSFINAKNLNRRIVLDLIRFTPGGISRAELARQTQLTRAAITSIIGEMLNEGLIRGSGKRLATGGRRPILLELNPKRGKVVGLDIGATHLMIVLADFAARVLDEEEFPFDVTLGPEKCTSDIDQKLVHLLAKNGLGHEDILAFGVGVPGPVVAEGGLVSAPPIMPGWHNFPIRDHLQRLWCGQVSVNNDAELGALGEWAYGAGRGERHLAYLKVGSGVGAGLLLDGHIYHGATGCAGEIGHITILDGGPRCSCGNTGCLEALAGGYAIALKAREAVLAGRRTRLASIVPPEKITARDVTAAARRGDLVAQQIVSETGAYLGIAVAGLVNLFNPNMVIVGGGVAQMGDQLLEPIRQAVNQRSLPAAAQAVRIVAALLGRRSSALGAVAQALNTALLSMI
jgi:glucokinase-like ROK family protein